jgi:hypothetical protein
MRRSLPVLGAVSLLLTIAACGSAPQNVFKGQSPQTILSTALRVAERFGGVHYVIQTSSSGNQQETVTGDAESNQGAQSIVVGQDEAIVKAIGTTAYVLGNQGGLQNIVGWGPSASSKYSGQWVSVSPHDSLYRIIVQAVLLKGMLSQVTPTPPLGESTTGTLAGRQVIGIGGGLSTGAKTASSTLWVATASPTIPIGEDVQTTSNGKIVRSVGAFSKWGERFVLKAPSNTVALSSISTNQ